MSPAAPSDHSSSSRLAAATRWLKAGLNAGGPALPTRPGSRRAHRILAMAVVFATAAAGAVVLQTRQSAETSEAVTYLNSFNGVFSKDDLWMVGTGDWYVRPAYVSQPWTATSEDFNDRTEQGYYKTGDADGSACGSAAAYWQNLAMGPILIAQGDNRIAQVGWDQAGGDAGVVFSGNGNCYTIPDMTPSAAAFDTTWGGEVNQKTGEIYMINSATEDFDGDGVNPGSDTTDPQFQLIKIVNNGTQAAPSFAVQYLAASSTAPPAPGANTLAQAAFLAGKGTAASFGGNWGLGSDMAIDANGNAYRMARFDLSGTTNDVWALVRFNVPRNADGTPSSTGWTYNVVKVLDNTAADSVWGMAFLNGALYTGHASDAIHRWDPISGTSEYLGNPIPLRDLASAQMAPVIEGRVYRDVNGDGVITPGQDTGLGGVTLEIWQQVGTAAPVYRGPLTTDTDGTYSALLPSARDTFYIRVVPSTAAGINVGQSYASAGTYGTGGAVNVVTPLCFSTEGDYREQTASGPCRGARADGIDPPTITSPIAATGGANTVTKIEMNSDSAVVTADFGLSTGLSWGDAPDTYKTSNANEGPYGAPDALYLGEKLSHYPDGAPSETASDHDATDDGLFVTPKQNDNTYEESDWVLAQNQVLAVGVPYRFRVKMSGAAVPGASAKAWLSPLTGHGQAAETLSSALLGGPADQNGYVHGEYTVPATAPAGGLANVYARARVGQDSNFTQDSRGTGDPATTAWVPRGEIEDYRLAIANGVLRIKARTTGGQAAHVNLSVSNVLATAPSQTQVSLLTNADGSFVRSPAALAIVNMAQPSTITTTGVGPASATGLNGWKLMANATRCYNSVTGAVIPATATSSELGVTAFSSMLQDVTCELTYGAAVTGQYSTLEVTPVPDPASPLTTGPGAYQVKVTAHGYVTDAEGQTVEVPVPGVEIAFALDPSAGDATLDGAFFAPNSDRTYTCVLNDQGECTVTVQAKHRGDYLVSAKAEGGTVDVGSAHLYFTEGNPSEDQSYAQITQRENQLADYQAPGTSQATWGKQTITVSVRDALREPVTSAAGDLSVAAATGDLWNGEGLGFSDGGAFVCAETPQNGACYSGDYQVVVYSARAGERQLVVTLGTGANAFPIKNIGDSTTVLKTTYATPPVSATDSTLIVSPSVPVNDPDSRTGAPDGVPSLIDVGSPYNVTVTTWDSGRNNKVGNVSFALVLAGADCHGTFPDGQTTTTLSTSELGRYPTTVSSSQAGSCTLTATLTGPGTAVGGSPKTLRWGDPIVDPGNPNTWFDVSTDEVVADGAHYGTVTASLYGTNGLPVTTVTDLHANGPAGGGVTVGTFTHQGNGVYTASFSGVDPGDKLIQVFQDAQGIPVKAQGGNDTAHLIPGPGTAATSWLVQPTDSAVADGVATITIGARVFDKDGHPADRGSVAFTIDTDLAVGTTQGSAVITAQVNSAGWAEIKVTSRKATSVHGVYVVTATIGGEAINAVRGEDEAAELRRDGKVNPVFIAGDPDPLKSVLTVPTAAGGATKVANGTEQHRVQILVKDANDNPVPDASIQFDYTCVGQAGYTCSGSWTGVHTGADGIGYYDWSTAKASTWTIAGFLGADQVQGSPGTAVFKPGPPVGGPDKTRLEPPAAAARADGSDTQTVLAYVIDGQGNAIPDASVSFTIPANVTANGVTGPGPVAATTDADGIARLVAVSGLVGVYSVTATVTTDSGTINITEGSPARIEFTNTQLDLSDSVLTVTTAPAVKTVRSEYHQVKADLIDTTGQPYQPATTVVFAYRLGTTGAWTNGPALTTAAGTVTWTDFTVAIAGTYQVRATVGGVQVGAIQEAKFGPGPVDAAATLASLYVDSTPRANDGVATVPASMKAQDADGNAVKNVPLSFELLYAGNGPVFTSTNGKTASGTSGDDGLVHVSITSLYEGHFDVRGQIGADLSGAPYPKANFTVDVPDPARSSFSVAPTAANASPAQVIADNSDSYTATIVLRNAAGVAINGVGGTLYFTPKGIPGATEQTVPFIVGVNGAPQGTAEVVLKTLKAGLWDVGVKIGADPVATQPLGTVTTVEVEFVPGPIAHGADRSRLVSPTAAAKADGTDTQTVTAHVMDANQNPYKAADVVFSLPANVKSGTLTGEVTVRTDDQGVARLVATSTVVGEYNITARVGSVALTHSSPAKARFTNADLSLPNSKFTIPTAGTEKVVLSEHHTPKVELFDATGNAYLPATSVTFSYKLASASTWTAGATLPTSGGVVTWTAFTVAAAGTYDVKAEVSSGQVGGVLQAAFGPGPIDLDLTRASFWHSTGAVLSDNHATHSASIVVQDASTNPIRNQAVTFTLDPAKAAHFVDQATGADLGKSVNVLSSDVGLTRIWLADGTPETTHLTVAIGSDQVGETDFQFSTDAPSALNSSWVVTPAGAQVADGVAAFTATVTVRDATTPTPLLVPNAEVAFEVPAQVRIVEAGPYLTGSNGQVTVHLTSEIADTYPVRALIGGDGIAPDPTSITFEAGPISFEPGKTTLRGPGVTAVANGTARLAATATVRDAKANPVVDAVVEFSVPAGLTAKTAAGDLAGPAVVEVAVDPVTAVAVLEYVTTVADSYEVTARAKKGAAGAYGDITDGSPATLTFTHGPVSAATSVIAKDRPGPLTADGVQAYGVTVTLLDAEGNAHTQADVPVRVTYTLGSQTTEEDLLTNAAGIASTSFATPVAGHWQATATVASAPVGVGSPLPLDFEPGPADPDVSVFSTTTGNVLANGTAAHSAWVVVTDAQGNPVTGRTVAFAVATGAPAVAGPVLTGGSPSATAVSCDPSAADAPTWCDQAGKALVYVTSNEPGSFAASATLESQNVNGSPRDVTFESGPADEVTSSYTITPLASTANTVSVPASGADPYTVTVTARSVAQLLVPGAQVRLDGLDPAVAVSPAEAGFTGTPASANFGTFTWQLTSTQAAAFTGRVQLLTVDGWQNVGEPFLARFGATDPVAGNSRLSIPTAAGGATKVADGSQTHRAEVELRDANQNLVPGAQVVFTWSYPNGGGTESGTYQTASGNNGVAVFEFSSTKAVTWTIAATVGGQAVLDSPRQADFIAGPPAGATSELISPPAAARGNGEGVQAVQLILRDANGNTAGCWDGAVEVPCDAAFTIPAGTWVSQGATRISGPATVVVQAGLSRAATGAGLAVIELYGDMGQWQIFASVNGEPVTRADGVADLNGQPRPAVIRFTDAIAPGQPTLDPSDGHHISGSVDQGDLLDAAEGELVAVVVDPATGDELARCAVGPDGTFDCELAGLEDGTEIRVRIEDSAHNPSGQVGTVVDAVAPGEPVPGPSDGTEIGGKGREPGDAIIVTDEDGEELCRAVVGEDLAWSCELDPPLDEGDMVTIIERDPAGNATEVPWRIGVPRVVMGTPVLERGATQTATGFNFQPGEEVTAVMHSDPVALGAATADSDGKVVFTWTIPETAAIGSHQVVLTAPLSGEASADFVVQALVFTGASGMVGAIGSALGLLAAGFLLLLAARRRRREEGTA
ncbi:MAG: Ig-like domain-containing protein [Bifidobacteriaceae bacterium]|jgi:hypothetical protein|nr:Ig-like domain-containing protein [Bifidobacteriaceae bacterium]